MTASLRIMLDDYPIRRFGGPLGRLQRADMMALDTVSATLPSDLAAATLGGNTPHAQVRCNDAVKYTAKDGYWQRATPR